MEGGGTISDNLQSLPSGYGRVDRTKAYVVENLSKNLATALVAAEFDMSVSALHHIFKRETGQNFRRYTETIRMQKAKELLNERRMIIKEIMVVTGYSTRTTFTRAFKRHFKKPPGTFLR